MSSLSGRVVDTNKNSIEGAYVTVEEMPKMKPIKTSSDGIFNIYNIPYKYSEQVRICVRKDGYITHTEDVVIGARPPKIELKKVAK